MNYFPKRAGQSEAAKLTNESWVEKSIEEWNLNLNKLPAGGFYKKKMRMELAGWLTKSEE